VTEKDESRSMQLVFIGDIALGESPSSFGLGVSRSLGAPLYRQWGEYLSRYRGDIILGNFEGTVSSQSSYPADDIMFSSMRIDPQLAGPLRLSGISHVSLANNHSRDHGEAAFQESRNYLDAQQIVALEHFKQAGKVYEICNEGISIGLVALNFVDKTMGKKDKSISVGMEDLPAILELIIEQKQRFNHLIITVHWGDNYGLWPNNMQMDVAKQLASAGASAVIGHHPHNIQAVNTIDGVPVVYSLGSFCFENKSPFTRLGQIIVLQCTENDLTITDHRHISIDRNYRISESLSPIQRLVVLLARSRPSASVNFAYVRVVRLWIFTVSLYRVVTNGNFGRYLKWFKYRYAKQQS
jgi:hypothetical protein